MASGNPSSERQTASTTGRLSDDQRGLWALACFAGTAPLLAMSLPMSCRISWSVSAVLGNLIGETFGYILTAAWTLLVVVALGRSIAGRWFAALGAASAVLVLAGVLSPLDLPVVDNANLIGYILWSIWLVVFAILLLRRPRTSTAAGVPASASAERR